MSYKDYLPEGIWHWATTPAQEQVQPQGRFPWLLRQRLWCSGLQKVPGSATLPGTCLVPALFPLVISVLHPLRLCLPGDRAGRLETGPARKGGDFSSSRHTKDWSRSTADLTSALGSTSDKMTFIGPSQPKPFDDNVFVK